MEGKDGAKFKEYIEYSCKAYNILRKNASLLINLFMMMLMTGIPELQSESDIHYLRDSLSPELSDIDAAAKFKNLIHKSLTTKSTQINNFIHNVAH